MKSFSISELQFAEIVYKNGALVESSINSENFSSSSEREENFVKEKQACFSFNGEIYLLKFTISYGEKITSYSPANGFCKEHKELLGIEKITC